MSGYEPYRPVFGNPIISDYVVLMNGEGELVFMIPRNPALDAMDYRRKFWFNIHKNKIIVGGCTFRVAFADVKPELVEKARQNKNILLVEYEGDQAVRATPCEFSADIREEDFTELSFA